MKKLELIKRIEVLPYTEGPIADTITINRNWILESIEQLDEPEMGHADEAPRYVKNILARLRELPLHDREVWLKVIMSEFKQDFSQAKWREGYEQGKIEGMIEREKVKIPSIVAQWIGYAKGWNKGLHYALSNASDEVLEWLCVDKLKRQELFARAWLDGYTVEEEKKYRITLLNRNDGDLYLVNQNADLADKYGHFSPVVLLFTKCTNFSKKCYELTKKEVVSYDFGWVFDCPGIKIEEVKDE